MNTTTMEISFFKGSPRRFRTFSRSVLTTDYTDFTDKKFPIRETREIRG